MPSASASPSSTSCAAASGAAAAKSSCLLLYAQPLGETAKARLAIMRETEDGFRIAEEDLKLRGAGELLGTRQSGAARHAPRRSRRPWRAAAGRRRTMPA